MYDGERGHKTASTLWTSDAASARRLAQYHYCKAPARIVSGSAAEDNSEMAASTEKYVTVQELTRKYLQEDATVKFMLQKLEEVQLAACIFFRESRVPQQQLR
jgi:hypothetical protein